MTDPLERAALLAAAGERVAAARRGSGGVVVYEGPAGIGKTTVLAAAAERAEGLTVVRALPSELERTFAYGVARRLLGPLLAALPATELDVLRRSPAAAALRMLEAAGAGTDGGAEHAVVHGLTWLLADAAARTPVLLVLDDAHWADEASLAWLAFLVTRVEDLPVAILIATRAVGPRDTGGLARLLAMREHVPVRAVPPLTPAAVSTLIARRHGSRAAAREGERIAAATGGNPFLVAELLRGWAAGSPLERLPVTMTMRRAVSRRIAEAGPDAGALADAVALLGGDGIAPVDAAELARLGPDAARAAADGLAAADVLTTGTRLGFVHPLVREAVYGTMTPLERAERHARAARITAAAGREPDRVAAHLLATLPAGDPWVVERLREAAAEALAQGAPGPACRRLRRALEEPPAGAHRAEVLCELGEAAARAQAPDAERCVRAALAVCGGGERAAVLGLTLGRLLLAAGRAAEACAALTRALAEADDGESEPALYIRAELTGPVRAQPGLGPVALRAATAGRRLRAQPGLGPVALRTAAAAGRTRRELHGATPGERALLASLACRAAAEGRPARLVRSLAERALRDDLLLDDTGLAAFVPYAVTAALSAVDEHASALAHLDAALDRARRRGSPAGYALARAGRAAALLRTGSLGEAEADARDALGIAVEHGLASAVPLALAPLVRVEVERGRLDEAEAALAAHGFADEIAPTALPAAVRHARGRVRLARGRHEEAAADFLAAGAALLEASTPTPAVLPWRSDAALALAAVGEAERAARLAAEERALCVQAGAPTALGLALRAGALVGPPGRRADELRDAVEHLRRAGARLELARALHDLGVARLRAGHRNAGRDALREALDLADRCGADAVADRAHGELAVAGARPRRRRLSGPEALTAAERRVVDLAAGGRSNREIAAELFLSLKTVETHLSHAYMKLSVRRRGDLAEALGAAA